MKGQRKIIVHESNGQSYCRSIPIEPSDNLTRSELMRIQSILGWRLKAFKNNKRTFTRESEITRKLTILIEKLQEK